MAFRVFENVAVTFGTCVALSSFALASVGCEDTEAIEKAKKKEELKQQRLDHVKEAITRCDKQVPDLREAQKKTDLQALDRFAAIHSELSALDACLDARLKEFGEMKMLDTEIHPGHTAQSLLEARLARVQAELPITTQLNPWPRPFMVLEGSARIFRTKKDREVFLGHLTKLKAAQEKLKDDPVAAWHPVPFWEEAPQKFAETTLDEPQWDKSPITKEAAIAFLKKAQKATETTRTFASLCKNPVTFDGEEHDPKTLIAGEETLVDNVLERLASVDEGSLYADAQGVSIGPGLLWLTCSSEKCTSVSGIKIAKMDSNPK